MTGTWKHKRNGRLIEAREPFIWEAGHASVLAKNITTGRQFWLTKSGLYRNYERTDA